MAADPRATVLHQYIDAGKRVFALTADLGDAKDALAEAEATIATHITDLECWVYGDIALVRDPITHRVISKRVVRLEG